MFAGKFAKAQLLATMKNSCLPKLICELNAMPQKDKLTDSEKALLSLIRSVSSTRSVHHCANQNLDIPASRSCPRDQENYIRDWDSLFPFKGKQAGIGFCTVDFG